MQQHTDIYRQHQSATASLGMGSASAVQEFPARLAKHTAQAHEVRASPCLTHESPTCRSAGVSLAPDGASSPNASISLSHTIAYAIQSNPTQLSQTATHAHSPATMDTSRTLPNPPATTFTDSLFGSNAESPTHTDSPMSEDGSPPPRRDSSDPAPVSLAQAIGAGATALSDLSQVDLFASYMSSLSSPQDRVVAMGVIDSTTKSSVLAALVRSKGLRTIKSWLDAPDLQDGLAALTFKVLDKLPIDVEALRVSDLGKVLNRLIKRNAASLSPGANKQCWSPCMPCLVALLRLSQAMAWTAFGLLLRWVCKHVGCIAVTSVFKKHGCLPLNPFNKPNQHHHHHHHHQQQQSSIHA
ncbi:hypothetical protein BC831DRAFT_481027 [Entophlyctis helioformis]|nr:hypothetical protein BC831DRAFT_481027 [Entophlyctis helioformis]